MTDEEGRPVSNSKQARTDENDQSELLWQENGNLRTKVLEYEAELETKQSVIEKKERTLLRLQHVIDEKGTQLVHAGTESTHLLGEIEKLFNKNKMKKELLAKEVTKTTELKQ